MKINSEDLSSEVDDNSDFENLDNSIEKVKLSPDDQFQIAFDMLRAQKFDQAKDALEQFISENSENDLSGSAHYWLGEIHLLQKEFREAALVFAEGYQKFPKSIKAPDMLYKLSNALVNIDKDLEACNILKKLSNEFPKNQLSEKSNTKYIDLNCDESIQ